MAKIDLAQDIQPLTTFRNNSVKMMKQIKRTKRPIVLTVNGRPEMVVQSVAEYQRLRELEEAEDIRQAIREGEEDIRAGRTRPVREVFAEIKKKYRHAG